LISLVNFYVSTLIHQYNTKPRAQATIAILLKQSLGDDMATLVLNAFNVNTAVGAQLDTIGKYVGLPRNIGSPTLGLTFGFVVPGYGTGNNPNGFLTPVTLNNSGVVFYNPGGPGTQNVDLPDNVYRFMLQLKIILNTNDARLSSVMALLWQFFGTSVSLVDNQNMTITYTVAANAPASSALLAAYLPKPMGVGISVLAGDEEFTRVTSDGSTRETSDGSTRIGYIYP
jgi:hypothetical protein